MDQLFGFRIARLARRLRQAVDAELGAYGLTEATWRPLVYVARLGAGVRQKELATALGIEGPSLVRLLDGLERRGLIERRADGTDRRARGIYLTPAGRALERRVAKVSNAVQRRVLADVAPADLAACDRAFAVMEGALDGAAAAAPPARLKASA
jgi:MarR family transcriptional regulator for hemolysin